MFEDFAKTADLLPPEAVAEWREAAVPMAKRGVSRRWLTRLVADAQSHLNRAAPAPAAFARRTGPLTPESLEPARAQSADGTPYRFLNTHALVAELIKPLTAARQAPLYAFAPERCRGAPQTFVSHTWSALLIGPERQRIGTLDALGDPPEDGEEDEYLWIDFACYNQHVIESISEDMRGVIGEIGSLSIAATPAPLFSRSWCLWELLSARQTEAAIQTRTLRSGYRNDKILCVNALYRSFRGIEQARSVSALDQREIFEALVAHFGGAQAADEGIARLIEEEFADPFYELQPRDEALRYSPLPWSFAQQRKEEAETAPFFLPGLLEAEMLGSGRSVGEVFTESGLRAVPPDQLSDIVDARQTVAYGADLRGAEISDPSAAEGVAAASMDVKILTDPAAAGQAPINQTRMRMPCPRCGETIEAPMRPRYVFSEDPQSSWAGLLQGRTADACGHCGLILDGRPSTFHALSWTGATMEPPEGRTLSVEIYEKLVEELLQGVRKRPPLLIFGRFGDVSAALRPDRGEPFLMIPYAALVYRDVVALQQPLEIVVREALRAQDPHVAYGVVKNASIVHPDLFFYNYNTLLAIAEIGDQAAAPGAMRLLADFGETAETMASFRKAPTLDREQAYVVLPENPEEQVVEEQGLRFPCRQARFDAHQDLEILPGVAETGARPLWMTPQPPLPGPQRFLLDLNLHAHGELVLAARSGAVSGALAAAMLRARERVEAAAPDVSEAQRAQAQEYYATIGGRALAAFL